MRFVVIFQNNEIVLRSCGLLIWLDTRLDILVIHFFGKYSFLMWEMHFQEAGSLWVLWFSVFFFSYCPREMYFKVLKKMWFCWLSEKCKDMVLSLIGINIKFFLRNCSDVRACWRHCMSMATQFMPCEVSHERDDSSYGSSNILLLEWSGVWCV